MRENKELERVELVGSSALLGSLALRRWILREAFEEYRELVLRLYSSTACVRACFFAA